MVYIGVSLQQKSGCAGQEKIRRWFCCRGRRADFNGTGYIAKGAALANVIGQGELAGIDDEPTHSNRVVLDQHTAIEGRGEPVRVVSMIRGKNI